MRRRRARTEQLDRPLEIVERDELVGGVGLGDVARADHDRVDAGLRPQRGLGPEVERADRRARTAARARRARRTRTARGRSSCRSRSPDRSRGRARDSRSQPARSKPGYGRSDHSSSPRAGITLNATPPCERRDVQADAGHAGGTVVDAAVAPTSSSARREPRERRERLRQVIGLRRVAAGPEQRRALTEHAAMRDAGRARRGLAHDHLADLARVRRLRGTRASRRCRLPRRRRTARRRPRAPARARRASPRSRPWCRRCRARRAVRPRSCGCHGSRDQPAFAGTVSTCALITRRGVPQRANT